jgi:cyclic-di-AMP phosphodiesterase PgpH
LNKSFWSDLRHNLAQVIYCPACQWWGRALFGTTFVCLGATLSQRFIWEPQLKVGTTVMWDIVVPHTAKVVDVEATKRVVQAARKDLPLMYQIDAQATQKSQQKLAELITLGDRARQQAGAFPYFSSSLISLDTQRYLRASSKTNLLQIQANARQPVSSNLAGGDRQAQELAEILTEDQYGNFNQKLTEARANYRRAQANLNPVFTNGTKSLLDLSEPDWQQTKIVSQKALTEILAGGLVAGLPAEMRRSRIRDQVLTSNPESRVVTEVILDRSLFANLKPDHLATEQIATQVVKSIEPQMVTLAAGTILVKAGDRLGEREFTFLDGLGLTQRRLNILAISLVLGGVAGGMVLVWLAIAYGSRWLKMRLHLPDLATIAVVAIGVTFTSVTLGANLGLAVLPFIPLAGAGMILGSFYGNRLAALATSILGFWLWLGIELTLSAYLPILLGAIAAAVFTNRPQTRSQLAMIGLLVAAIQAISYLILASIGGNLVTLAIVYYAAGGLISSMVALGAIPYLEQLSYYPTPIRLAELANLDRPLLRRLVTEAPGTFQHTLFVANLAEAGARELGADTALVRTGTLYHDVGKTLKPEYFIENQMGQLNPHDLMDDPWHSATIIKEHVSGGLKLAQKYRLPLLLQAFIPEHQGTIAISYFYYKAKEKLPEVHEDEFRYPGPIPQSRETAIVMLADACEAALRSLGADTSLEQSVEMVNRIFQKRWDDGQLLDSGLSEANLGQLAPVFIRVWQQHNHGRIKYPALAQKLDPTGSAMPEHIHQAIGFRAELPTAATEKSQVPL